MSSREKTQSTKQATSNLDAIALEVMRNGFVQICEEVTITMLKTAHSVIFNEGKDLSTGLFDRKARLVAQDSQGCPVHIAAMSQSVKAGIEQYGIENINDGDIFLINDCYSGGTHLPDITVFAPVYWDGEIVGFIANRGHHADVGGMSPGSMPGDATEMYQEGLILPAIRIFEAGVRNSDVWNIILKNVRLPDKTEGDISAQTSGIRTGMRRFHSLLERYGASMIAAGIDQILTYSERHMRAEIEAIPDGEYAFVDYMDTDGIQKRPVKIVLTARKRGSGIEFDFEGSDAQVGGCVNCVFSVTLSAVWIGMLMLTDPNIHPSEGAFIPILVKAPEGTVVNPYPPASTVSGLTETCNRLIDMVIAVLAPGLPHRSRAGELGACNVYTLGGQRSAAGSDKGKRKEQWVSILNPKGGWGGGADKDGWTCIQDPLSNCRNQPVEALETEFPMIVRHYSLRTGAEGAGKHRGGYGLRRDIEMTENCTMSTCTDRSVIPPFGLFGGDDGACNTMCIKRVGSNEWEPISSRASNITLTAGDVVRIDTAIGGGYGNPLEREPNLVAMDVANEYLPDRVAAEKIYGVVMSDAFIVDHNETLRLRTSMARNSDEGNLPRRAANVAERKPSFQPY